MTIKVCGRIRCFTYTFDTITQREGRKERKDINYIDAEEIDKKEERDGRVDREGEKVKKGERHTNTERGVIKLTQGKVK